MDFKTIFIISIIYIIFILRWLQDDQGETRRLWLEGLFYHLLNLVTESWKYQGPGKDS